MRVRYLSLQFSLWSIIMSWLCTSPKVTPLSDRLLHLTLTLGPRSFSSLFKIATTPWGYHLQRTDLYFLISLHIVRTFVNRPFMKPFSNFPTWICSLFPIWALMIIMTQLWWIVSPLLIESPIFQKKLDINSDFFKTVDLIFLKCTIQTKQIISVWQIRPRQSATSAIYDGKLIRWSTGYSVAVQLANNEESFCVGEWWTKFI